MKKLLLLSSSFLLTTLLIAKTPSSKLLDYFPFEVNSNSNTLLSITKWYVNDNSLTGDIFTTAIGNDTNSGAVAAPFATISNALSVAAAGDTIYVDAGTYTEQVTITKGITIIGAGQNLTTITNNPAVALLPAAGSFTEIGLVQTVQNIGDVHISNMSVIPALSSTPYMPHCIVIQSGGSVKGCKTNSGGGGGQGVFFRIQNTIKSALIENNNISAEYIAINCEGSGLSVTLLNNTINIANPGFSAGAFIGADGPGFSPVVQFTAMGNFLTGYVTSGFQVFSSNASITQNSFLGTGLAIQQYASSNVLNANCNWYGTTNAGTIASKISGNITYNPWLSNGTDNSSNPGFQPIPGSCSGRQKFYVNDNSLSDNVFTTAVGNDNNSGGPAAPFATITKAISFAIAGDTIYVDAGIYTEQVTLDKGITLIGAGSGVTIVLKPAVINPPPGPFTEPGTIQTAQNIGDVHIRDMSVTGDGSIGVTPIILQTGGSVKNCRLIGGNQGIFFRVDPAIKTALIENNYITVEYIGINCQGSGLSASLINNTIDLTNPFFAAGVFAGLDFGPLVRFTAFGNIVRNYNAQGMLANSYNTNITQNSFTGTGAHAIEQSTNSLGFATCNWYGTTNAAAVASKVSGFFSYTPYLTDGTNTITTYGNYAFLPVAGSCSEGVSNFYVNDNSRTNDVFTTAIGSNSNPGTRSAPFATLSYAISVAPANSVIHVDAGTYAEQVIIDRGIVINGAGRELTNFIKPASTLVPAPGPFTEIGLIETTQGIGDVHIRNISVNSVDGSSQNIIIQSGGSVNNCKLLNGGQGVFFRYASGSKNAAVEFNIIQPVGIGINCQGAGLTASIRNNTISNPSGYYSGIFAGLDFGFLPQITITNNKISNYSSLGIFANANSSNVTNNSIVGTQGIAIQGNALNATCNWYASTTPAITGPVIYSPFLTNGTDNDIYNQGFQPVPGSCNGIQHKFYVNDNNNVGNVFTTANGDNNNSGAPSAPLATINEALNRALAGDTIYVDAGTYAMANLTINKSVTILGSNYTVSPNTPSDKKQYNTGRNEESRITGSNFIIGADNITIKGLRFSPTTTAISSSADFSHIKLEKNYFDVSGTSNTISFQGSSNNPIVAFDFSVNDNRFDRADISVGTSINLGIVKSVFIDDNVFIESTTTGNPFRGFAVRTVVGQSVENTVFSNNYVKKLQVGVLPAVIQDWSITNNVFDSCAQGYNHTPGNAVSNNVSITANTFTNIRIGRSILVRGGLNGGINNLSISNNILNQEVDGINGVVGMIQLEFAASNTYGNVLITNNKLNLSGNYLNNGIGNSCGIILAGKHSNTTISGNELTFTAINASSPVLPVMPQIPTGIFINTDGGAGNGLIPSNAVFNITNNKISGFKGSIGIYDPNAAGITPTVGYGYLTTGATVNINNNSFTGDSISIDNGINSQEVQATCNWYGYANVQALINKVSKETGNYVPWLTNGTDSDIPTVGFQPIPGSCNGQPLQVRLDGHTDVTCNGAGNGSINITVLNGVAPYSFTWTKDGDPGFSSNAEDPTNLTPGTYHLAMTDALGTNIILDENGNPLVIDVTITEPTVLLATASGSNNSCYGTADGTATVTVTGGIAPYIYLWSNGATTSSVTSLVAGIYSVTVTDGNGCTTTASYEVTQPTLLTASADGNNVSCFGGSNGAVQVNVSGGTTPYSFLWSNGAVTPSVSGLIAGSYSVTVTDANGCATTVNYDVTQPAVLTASTTGNNVSCFGGSNGAVQANVSGGTTPYSFLWSNGAVSPSVSGLTAGNYSVTVTDANGCSTTASYTVTQPVVLSVTITGTTAFCNGSATAAPAGGTAPYTYLWNNGAVTPSINNVPAATYTVTVTDANGCTVAKSYTITGNSPINPTATVVPVSCFGLSNGSITVTGANGTAPFTYNINGAAFQTSNVFGGLPAGVYVVGAKSATGCIDFVTRTVSQPAAIAVILDSVRKTCSGVNGGRIFITVTGGNTGTKTYSWTGPNGFTSTVQDPNNLAVGTYNVTVADTRGCTGTLSVVMTDWPAISIVETVTNIACRGDLSGAINVSVNGGTGNGFIYSWTGPGAFRATTKDISSLRAGNYTLTVTDAGSGCSVTKIIAVTQPATSVSVTAATTAVNGCITQGTITATGAGGTAPYQYRLNTGTYQSSGVFTDIAGGTYTVWVKDNNGCTATRTVTVADNGSDAFEGNNGNNTKNQAKTITIGITNSARIAIPTDVADWFRFTVPAGSNSYTITLSHPSSSFEFLLYPAANNQPPLTPTDSSAGAKTYSLTGATPNGTTYYLKVTGGLSFTCYQFAVNNTVQPLAARKSLIGIEEAKAPEKMTSKVYPNPHQGAFTLSIDAPESGKAIVELYNAVGQKVMVKEVMLIKGNSNTVQFNGFKDAILLYKVSSGKWQTEGKIIGQY